MQFNKLFKIFFEIIVFYLMFLFGTASQLLWSWGCTILSVFKVLGFQSNKISPDSLKESIKLLIVDAEIPAFSTIVHWETLFLNCWMWTTSLFKVLPFIPNHDTVYLWYNPSRLNMLKHVDGIKFRMSVYLQKSLKCVSLRSLRPCMFNICVTWIFLCSPVLYNNNSIPFYLWSSV